MTGGADLDTFVFVENGGNDTIVDFVVDLDLIDLSAFNIGFSDLVFAGNVITIDGVDDFSITLNGRWCCNPQRGRLHFLSERHNLIGKGLLAGPFSLSCATFLGSLFERANFTLKNVH